MNQIMYVKIEIEKNGRVYSFNLPLGAPIGEAYDVAHECLQEIIKMSETAANAAKRPMESSSDTKE